MTPKPKPQAKKAVEESTSELQEVESKRAKKEQSEGTLAKKSLLTYFGYNTSDKCQNPANKTLALSMKTEYEKCDNAMASEFAKKFMASKGTGDFSWHKNFKEEYGVTKTEKEEFKANYMSRLPSFFFFCSCPEAAVCLSPEAYTCLSQELMSQYLQHYNPNFNN
jgi:hypothetical protein